MNKLLILLLAILCLLSACKTDSSPPTEPTKTFMLAIISPPGQVPFDFEADEAIGDYKPASGLLRVQGTNLFNGKDKIEIIIRNAGEKITGSYSVGKFEGNANVRAEFIDGQSTWSARSLCGTIHISKFEETNVAGTYYLSATFSFSAQASGGEVKVESGEIENAVIIEG